MKKDEDGTDIEPVEEEWTPPKPTSPDGILYARLAIAWKRKSDETSRISRIQGDRQSARINELETEIERVKTENEEEHQEFVSLKGETDQLAGEADGLLRKEMNIDKRVTGNLESILASVRKVEDAMSGRKPNAWFRMGWEFVTIIGLLVLVWQYGYNPAFREGINKNAFAIVILVSVVAYVLFRVQKGRKK